MDAGSIPAASTINYNILMKAFLINLDKAKERLASCKIEFFKLGLNFELIEAIDGKNLSLPNKNINSFFYMVKHGKKINLNELGCYLSHLKALRRFIECKEEFALICEDDIEFNEDLLQVVNKAIKSPIYFDLLRLSGSENKNKEKGLPIKLLSLVNNFSLSINLTYKPIAACYLVNKKAANKILNRIEVMHLPFDYAFDRDWILGIRSLCIYPSPVSLKNEFHLGSSYIKATKKYRLKNIIRIWTVVPYRLFNGFIRIVYKIFILLKIKILEI